MSEVFLCRRTRNSVHATSVQLEHLQRLKGLSHESQGQNLALTVLYMPYSLDSGNQYVNRSSYFATSVSHQDPKIIIRNPKPQSIIQHYLKLTEVPLLL